MSSYARPERKSERKPSKRREAAKFGFAAAWVCVCASGCAAVLGIDEPNVVSGDGGSEAEGSQVTDAGPDRVAEGGPDRAVEAGPDQAAEAGLDADAADASDSADSVATATNLITNGDFSMGQTDWAIVSGSGSITMPSAGQLCVSIPSGQNTVLGWTPGVALVAGTPYTFSYTAMATPMLTMDAKVGHSESPFTADFEATSDVIPTSFSAFVHPFTAPSPSDTSAGLAFTIPTPSGNTSSAEMVCFESVSLIQN